MQVGIVSLCVCGGGVGEEILVCACFGVVCGCVSGVSCVRVVRCARVAGRGCMMYSALIHA